MYSGLLYATPTLRRLLLQRLLLPRREEAKRSEVEAGARSRSTVIGSEVRGEHPLVREVILDNPVHAEKKLREALGKVGKETSRRFPKALPDILWQILVMVFLQNLACSEGGTPGIVTYAAKTHLVPQDPHEVAHGATIVLPVFAQVVDQVPVQAVAKPVAADHLLSTRFQIEDNLRFAFHDLESVRRIAEEVEGLGW